MKKVFLIIACFCALLISCSTPDQQERIIAGEETVIDTLPGSAPFLTKDSKGNTIISWIRTFNDSSAIFCYAVSTDGGRSFGSTITIPPSSNVHPHGENIPKVIFKPSGEIIALWGSSNPNPKNKYSGLVFYAQSFDEGKTWTEAKPLVKDTAGFDQRYFDVALFPNGEAGIIWLDNRKTVAAEGSGLYLATTNGKNGFANEQLISQPCCQCCRTDLYIDKENGIHALYRGIIADSVRDMVHIASTDGGKTFSAPKKISNDNWVLRGCPHTGPAMIENNEGLHFAWYTGGRKKGSYFTSSKNNGASFEGEDSISSLGKHPQLCLLPNNDLITVWDETMPSKKIMSVVGLQLRSAKGENLSKKFISTNKYSATYPVACSIGEQAALVAYCIEKNNKKQVAYQVVQVQ